MFKNFIKKIPAGNMMVPLILAALINTFLPSILHFGVFTEALF
ncbi:2-keto-3-deoxygluconate permease, partial [Anaerococcus sp.]